MEIDGVFNEPQITQIIICGLPQGTVLWPLLVQGFIITLLFLDTKGEIISFADATTVIYTRPK